ncbi:hypothetical protein CA13_67010 [Planctomycetes bacterium CA13]|uniref:ASPIC/UnbV domain-containing protein n=1 Tax=Novipirellula herctigrandis TaxID=2527986 RepID=A0A5C5YMZ1_9BACT|nr:hypothetical protein CA13_67010 [Planctomycetes bacterium CA13]
MKRILILLAVLVVVAGLLFAFSRRTPVAEQQAGGVDSQTSADPNAAVAALDRTREALEATENFDSKIADKDWNTLLEQSPNDRSIALNRALNRVLLVDSLTGQATNSMLTAEEKQATRRQLPEAIDAARKAVDDFEKIDGDAVVGLWLRTRVDLHEASLLPATMTRSLRKDYFDRLVTAIHGDMGKRPESVILGGPLTTILDEMEDPIQGLPKAIQQQAAKTLGVMSDQHPENLFLALRAARIQLAIASPDASKAVQRTGRLASAIEPSLRRQTEPIGLTPSELVNQIIEAIGKKDFSTAENQMLLWFNVLNSTELVKTDRRRASPHPLDRLSFDSMRRASAQVAKSIGTSTAVSNIEFRTAKVGEIDNVKAAMPIDFNLDLNLDVITTTAEGNITLFQSPSSGAGNWDVAGSVDLGISVVGLGIADLFMVDSSDPNRLQYTTPDTTSSRHNTFFTVMAYGDEGIKFIAVDGRPTTALEERLSVIDKATGLEEVRSISSMIAGDLEGDGDLDLVVATGDKGIRTFINRGNRTFFETATVGEANSLVNQTSIIDMQIVDLDRDLDLDIVTLDQDGKVGLLENFLHLQFRFRSLKEIPAVESAFSVAVEDIDGNVSWDLIVTGAEKTVFAYSQTADAGAWTIDQTKVTDQRGSSLLLADFDNDLAFEAVQSSESGAVVIRLVDAGVQSVDTIEAVLGDQLVATADFNQDGLLDVLSLNGGKPVVATNTTATDNHYLQVRFRGIDDNNVNSGRVNHYSIGSIVEMRAGPYYRAEVITSPTTHFGLGKIDDATTLRVIFPNGLTQTIRDPGIDSLVEEEQTLKGSCPYLYAWDGEKYAFVTDCLWAAPLGLQVADGVVAKDRPWEYLKVDGDFVAEHDGRYDLRITEELWEVAYIDYVSLIAVDHPQEVDIWTNEKVGPAPIATPTVYAFPAESRTSAKQAKDARGRDITKMLSTIDKEYVQGFDRRIRQGLCPPHWIDVEFAEDFVPDAKSDQSIFLVLTGWILPTDTSLNIQIDQNPELPPIEFPSLWVPDPDAESGWRKAIDYVGFPGGKTKTIVVDVTDEMNRDDPRLRIRTSAQIYWDCAELVVQSEPASTTSHELMLRDSELVYRGFSRRVKESPLAPETYDYSHATMSPKWPPLRGQFTNYDACTVQLSAWDDSMVVMGSGDELRLQFSVPEHPVPPGWKRDFILHCVGWDKDADLNTLSGQSAGPLPFREMETYPPSRRQADQLEAVNQKNSDSRQRTQSFRAFWN